MGHDWQTRPRSGPTVPCGRSPTGAAASTVVLPFTRSFPSAIALAISLLSGTAMAADRSVVAPGGTIGPIGGTGLSATNASPSGITVITGPDGAVANPAGDGIVLDNSNGGDVTVTLGADVSGTGGDGVHILSTGGGRVAIGGDGAISGGPDTGLNGITIITDGDIAVDLGGPVLGTGIGIYAETVGGAIGIGGSGTTTATGAGGIAINAQAIGAGTETSDIRITRSGAILATGSGAAVGLNATSNLTGSGDVIVSVPGDITLGGTGSTGINAQILAAGASGGVRIDAGATISTGDGASNGINATNAGSGGVILSAGSIRLSSASTGTAINAESAGGDVTIVASGTIDGGAIGINAGASGTGTVRVTQNGAIGSLAAASGFGISTWGVDGAQVIASNAAITAGGNGINAHGTGSGLIDIDHTSGAVVSGAIAIDAGQVAGGAIDIDVSGGSLTGTSQQIRASTTSGAINIAVATGFVSSVTGVGIEAATTTGDISISAAGGLRSTASAAVHANSTTGNITVSNDGDWTGATTGLYAATNANGTVSVGAGAAITGQAGHGVELRSENGAIHVGGAGAIVSSAGGDAIHASSSATGHILVDGSGDTIATDGFAIRAVSSDAGGADAVTVHRSGTISGGAGGILAATLALGAVTVATGPGATTATSGEAIRATSVGGAVSVTTDGAVHGATGGIHAETTGEGAVTVTVRDGASGLSGAGISVGSGTGMVRVAVEGGIVTGGQSAIAVTGGSLDGSNSGTLLADGFADANALDFSGVGSGSFSNSGSATGMIATASGVTALSVRNSGTWTLNAGGTARLAGAMDTIDNTGNFYAYGNRLDGLEFFTNGSTGLFAVRNTVSLSGDLANAGTIAMANGTTGDSLSVGGSYTGGGMITLDVDMTGETADTLVVSGDVSGGTTLLSINDISTGLVTGKTVRLVGAGGANASTSFALGAPAGARNRSYDLTQVGSDWFLTLASLPADVFQAYGALLSSFQDGADFSQRFAGTPLGIAQGDGEGNGWVTSYSGVWSAVETRHARQTTGSGGQVSEGDYWKARFGGNAELAETSAGVWVGGLHAYYGHARSRASSASDSGTVDTEAFGIGASLTFIGDAGLYLDASAQLSRFRSDIETLSAGNVARANPGRGRLVSVEVGKRMALNEELALIPQAQLVYEGVDFDPIAGYSTIAMSGSDTISGRIGLGVDRRSAWETSSGASGTMRLYGLANLRARLSGRSSVNVDGTDHEIPDGGATGEIVAGGAVNWGEGRYGLFGEASASTGLSRPGEDYALGLKAGLKARF